MLPEQLVGEHAAEDADKHGADGEREHAAQAPVQRAVHHAALRHTLEHAPHYTTYLYYKLAI